MNMTRKVPCVVSGAVIGGVVGFVCGYFGPLLVTPAANQGPLLGIFITGPIGMFGGALAGYIYWSLGRRRRGPTACPNCFYDLRGNTTGICPECGMGFAELPPM